MSVNWSELAERFETITTTGELGGTDLATRVLEYVIGAEFFEQAVEHYVSFEPGYELARSVLARLRTDAATIHCYKIYKGSSSQSERQAAVELLAATGTSKVLEWISEFLADPDVTIQGQVMYLLDKLLYRRIVNEDKVEPLLKAALEHPSESIRNDAKSLLESITCE